MPPSRPLWWRSCRCVGGPRFSPPCLIWHPCHPSPSQSNLTIVNRLLGFLLEVFYWRCIIFIVLSITCYFHTVLIVGGILLDLLAVAYFVIACVFKEREYYDAATIAQEEQKAKARAQMEENTRTPPTV